VRRPQVAVVYHFFPHYRRAVVEALALSDAADFTFIGDDHEFLRSVEPARLSPKVRFELARTHHLGGPFMWQWRAFTIAFDRRFDTIIFHPVPHWPCTWMGAIAARIMGKRILFWGHGLRESPQGRKGLVRRVLNALPHEHLVYGRVAKALQVGMGWSPAKVHVIYNSLDFEEQSRIANSISDERLVSVRRELFGDASVPVIACSSRLIAMRRLDLLIEALAELAVRGRTANLLLIGDGPERTSLERLARDRGVRTHFEGACYDERRLAELIMASSVIASPGRVGLTVIHALTYGIPVVSHGDVRDQAPEWEAIIPGVTGGYFEAGNVPSLADALEPWIGSGARDSATVERCRGVVARFWNASYQRRAIERAVLGHPADDLFDLRELEAR
jgi:glycosyltransferase involved in cell wall biosynthesis